MCVEHSRSTELRLLIDTPVLLVLDRYRSRSRVRYRKKLFQGPSQTGVLTLSYVAEKDDRIVGRIAFSPVEISDGTKLKGWYCLGPVSIYSIIPDYQRQWIGTLTTLVEEGLGALRDMGAKGCALVGHPAYYPRFGFENTAKLVHEGIPPEVSFVMPFHAHTVRASI